MADLGDILGNRRLVAKDWNCNIWQSLDNIKEPGEFLVEFGKCTPFLLNSRDLVRLLSVLATALRSADFKANDPSKILFDKSVNANHLIHEEAIVNKSIKKSKKKKL